MKLNHIQHIGAKLPMFKDPAIDPQKIEALIKRGDLRALSNPNIPVDLLLKYADRYPVEVESNPSISMIGLESPNVAAELQYKLNYGFRYSAMEKLSINDQARIIADSLERTLPDAADLPLLADAVTRIVAWLRVLSGENYDSWGKPPNVFYTIMGNVNVFKLDFRKKKILSALYSALDRPLNGVLPMYRACMFVQKDESGYPHYSERCLEEMAAQANIVRKYYYAAFPVLPADVKKKRTKKPVIGAVAPFSLSIQAQNPNPQQLAAFQIVAPAYAEQFDGLWRLYLLENPGIAIIPGPDWQKKITAENNELYLYEEAFARLEKPENVPLAKPAMMLFFADCLEWMMREDDDSLARDPFLYAVKALRSEPGYGLDRAAVYAHNKIKEIKKWNPTAKEELEQVSVLKEIMEWADGSSTLERRAILHRLTNSTIDVASKILSGSELAPAIEAYKAFAGFLQKHLFAEQGDTVSGREKASPFPTLKKFLSLSQEKQNEIRDKNDAWLPSDMKGKRVYLHLNLGAKWSSRGLGTWSVKYGPNKKLVGHVYGMRLRNVTFEVSASGNMEAIVAKEKIVHAFVVGDVEEAYLIPGWAPSSEGYIPIRYSPDRSEDFFFMRSSNGKDWDIPVEGAYEVLAIGGIGKPIIPPPGRGLRFTFPWKPILAAGVIDMPPGEIQAGLEERRQAYLKNQAVWDEERWKKETTALLDQGFSLEDFRADLRKAEKARQTRFSRLGQSRVGAKSRRLQLPSFQT